MNYNFINYNRTFTDIYYALVDIFSDAGYKTEVGFISTWTNSATYQIKLDNWAVFKISASVIGKGAEDENQVALIYLETTGLIVEWNILESYETNKENLEKPLLICLIEKDVC